MTMRPLAIVHVDIEGGWGGSSRSLFELVSRLDRRQVQSIIAHRKRGPLESWYAEIGLPTFHVPEIGSFVPRERAAFRNFVFNLPQLVKLNTAARRIVEIARIHDARLIHLNYEGLFLLAQRIKKLSSIPMIGHSRAMIGDNAWGRWLARSLHGSIEHLFGISENEVRRFAKLTAQIPIGQAMSSNSTGCQVEVMHNIARAPLPRQTAAPAEIVYLGNLAESKGVFRIPHIARHLKSENPPDFQIRVYGSSRGRSNELRLQQLIKELDVADLVTLCGHATNIQEILSKASILIRPSMENDPWGRDVIEASAAGVPVVATGSYDGVVRDGVNGALVDIYDPGRFAGKISLLLNDKALWRNMSESGQDIGRALFGGEAQVRQFMGAVTAVTSELSENPRFVNRNSLDG